MTRPSSPTHPITTVMLIENGRTITNTEYTTFLSQIAGALGVAPVHVALRIVQRPRDEMAPIEGFAEVGAVCRVGARLIIQNPARAWDQWMIQRGIPTLAWPFDTRDETTRQVLAAARNEAWLRPQMGGLVVEAIRAAKSVTILGPGTGIRGGDDVCIGVGAFAPYLDPAPAFVVVERAALSVPVSEPGRSAVGMRSDAMVESTIPYIRYALTYTDTLVPDVNDKQAIAAARLTAGQREDFAKRMGPRTIARATLLDPLPRERPPSILWSPYRNAPTELGPISGTVPMLVTAIRALAPKIRIVVREHPGTLRWVTPQFALERNYLESLEVTFETVEVEDAPPQQPLHIHLLGEDLLLGDAATHVARWLAVERAGAVLQTAVTVPAHAQAAFDENGFVHPRSFNGAAVNAVALRPFPLVPIPE